MREVIRKLLREGLLDEDVKLAEKLLKQNNIPLDTPKYLQLREYLGQKNVGFLGQIVRLALSSKGIELLTVAEYIIGNKELIRSLPNQLSSYATFYDLEESVERLKTSRIVKKVVNKLTNKELGKILLSDLPEESNVKLLEKFLALSSSNRKEFLVKSDKYRTVDEFYSKLASFMDSIHKFNFKTVLNTINGMGNDEAVVLYSSNNMILVRIIKYSASRLIGSKSWCIVGDEDVFNYYTQNGENFQYFFFNFDFDVNDNEKMIAFTMDKDNKITACHDRYDYTFSNVLGYLDGLGIKSKIFEINSRQRQMDKLAGMDNQFKTRHSGENVLRYFKKIEKINGKEYSRKIFPRDYNDNLKLLSRKLLEFLFSKDVKGKNHLDIHVDKFEDVPIAVYDWDYSKVIGSDSINIVAYTLDNFDKINDDKYEYKTFGWDYESDKYHDKSAVYSKNALVEIMKKVYLSNIKMTRETKLAIINFLKDNGIDLLKLGQLKKGKTGQDLAPSEFGMLANRGEDMKASIQNKLSGLRRGEDINLSPTEINYAIDNGFRSIIEKYYKGMLPSFGENQLSYDNLNIYKKLGLLDDIAKVIVSKANNYGIDTLNSIEKSLYDMNSLHIKG